MNDILPPNTKHCRVCGYTEFAEKTFQVCPNDGSLLVGEAFYQRLDAMKKGVHQHFCMCCLVVWQHDGARVTNRHKAHCCPVCGEYITDIFMRGSEGYDFFPNWDGDQESATAKMRELRERDDFELVKIRRISRRVYWLNKK